MHIMLEPKKVTASAVISELQSSDMYLTLIARLFDLRANLNGVRVTEAFLDEIVENESKYVCHPLYADIRGLLANRTVGHMYNARTGEFYSTQIGSFYHFEKEIDGDNAYLVGYARVPKRNKALCTALGNLFTDNALKFSFEVNCGVYEEDSDGTMVIDADARNYWEGECVVTFPACETAIARQLVAECLGKGDENMADENIVTTETEVIAEEITTEEVVTENETQEETQIAEVETAETILVTKEHVEIEEVRAYNCDTGEEMQQRVVIETTERTPVQLAEENQEENEDEERSTEAEDDEEVVASVAAEESVPEEEDEDNKTCASVETPNWATLIAELQSSIESLRQEIAELKIPETAPSAIVAEVLSDITESEDVIIAESVTGDANEENVVNPFMASISAPKKYSLLDVEEKHTNKYSLLDRA